MSKSILLQLARDSIEEVLESKRTIDRTALLKEYPILGEDIASYITLKLDHKVRGSFGTIQAKQSLLEDIIFNAKSAAFLDKNVSPISTSEYLHCSVEVALLTPLQAVTYSSITDLKDKLTPHRDGVIIHTPNAIANFLPRMWQEYPGYDQFLKALVLSAGLKPDALSFTPNIYKYQIEKAEDEAIVQE